MKCPRCGYDLAPAGNCEQCARHSEPTLDERLKAGRPNLPCCGEGGACTGGSRCWHDEPDNIPENGD